MEFLILSDKKGFFGGKENMFLMSTLFQKHVADLGAIEGKGWNVNCK